MQAVGLEFRRLGPDQVEAFRAIRLEGLADSPEAFGTTLAAELARSMAQTAERLAQGLVLGAYRGDALVALAGLARNQGPRELHKAFVWGVFVRPAARGAGVATALIAALLARAEPEIEQVTLTVAADNAPARALYARLGFVEYGLEPRALKSDSDYLDEVLMVKFLG